MTHNTARLFASLAALGINPKMQTFAERKKVQKVVYLLDKVFGMNFNYNYDWYLHGPYSTRVTEIVFNVVEGRRSIDTNINVLSDEDNHKIEKMKAFLGKDLQSNDMLELLVSVDYLIKCKPNSSSRDKEIIKFLNEKKPYFSNDEIIAAIARMDKQMNQ